MRPYLISIAGESGVGKTTISNSIESFYGEDRVLKISGDDLHKWPRNHHNWHSITHLNPEANDLELGDLHLVSLLLGHPIARSHYNHHTGEFDPSQVLYPKEIIINEGLHAFYTPFAKSESDCKIFVDACERLRIHWKIQRDTKYRGYQLWEVIDAINLRKDDSGKLRKNQMENADLIIKIGTVDPIVELGVDKKVTPKFELKIINPNLPYDLVTFIQENIIK
jgi:uridine kinase